MKVDFGRNIPDIKGLAALCGGEIPGYIDPASLTTPVASLCTDSREASVGTCFIAIRGEKVDGHAFISRAAACGAVCALAEEVPADAAAFPIIVVDNVIAALGRMAEAYNRTSGAKIAAVTGSVGKTSTKEMIAAVLGSANREYHTKGNFNSVIGMPLSLVAMPEGTEFAVIEMGMSHLGEVRSMTMAARPDVAVVTTIGTSHLESLGTRENIARAKLEIAEGLNPEGVLLLCGGEPLLANHFLKDPRTRYFSPEDLASDYRAENIRTEDGGTVFDAYTRGKILRDVRINVLGRHNVAAALAAIAVGQIFGVAEEDIRRGLAGYAPVGLRQQIEKIGPYTLVCDCYNASPESMRAACEVLKTDSSAAGGRSIAVLGDMLELGENSDGFHRGVGEYFARAGVDRIFTFGVRAKSIGEGAESVRPGMTSVRTETDDDAAARTAQDVCAALRPGDVVLVKASRGIKAERIAEAIRKILA